jgi:hypothetical protein
MIGGWEEEEYKKRENFCDSPGINPQKTLPVLSLLPL